MTSKEEFFVGQMALISGIHPNALAYSMTTLGAGMMNSIFNFYYVKLFLNRYKISEAAFRQAQCLVLISHTLLRKFGYYKMIMFSFYLEGLAAAAMFVLGPEYYHLLAVYLTANMVIVQASFSLFNLPLADIVDADLKQYKRRSPLSSMIFGTNALFTKPAQSLAPIFVVAILNQFGYANLTKIAEPNPGLFLGLHYAMFCMICLVPLCIAIVQVLTWMPFSIQNSHLTPTL